MKSGLIYLFLLTCISTMAQNDFLPKYKFDVKSVDIFEDIRIAYVDEGPKDGKVLLFVHGLGGYIKNWDSSIDLLQSDYRCIALDLPGYGRSTLRDFAVADYLEFFAKAIDAFAQKLDLNDVTLIGHSMGGQTAIVVALNRPDWLTSLVLAAPAGFETFSDQEAAMLLSVSKAQNFMSHTEEQIRAGHAVNFVKMPPLGEELIQDRLLARQAPWFPDYCLIREMGVKGMLEHPVRNHLSSLDVPTLVIFGKNDLLIPNRYLHSEMTTEGIANIGKDIPGAQIAMLENAGHMLQMDQPAAFTQVIRNYLKPNNQTK